MRTDIPFITIFCAASLLLSCTQGKWNAGSSTYSLSFTSPLGGQAKPQTDSPLAPPSNLRSAR
ncbi:MAG: hypothetical protein V3T02_11960 [Alphaproteobacteria bacterium]